MSFIVAILVTGASGIVAQLLLLRELLITFLSNELSIGIILANWLILEAAGSFLAGKGIQRVRNKKALFVLMILVFSLAFPVCVYLARVWKGVIGVSPGEGLGLHQTFIASFLILLPVSLSHGALFTFACKIHSEISRRDAPSVGKVYFLETAGTLAGGLIFTYLLITFLNSFETAIGISLVNITICAWFMHPRWGMPSTGGLETGERAPLFNRALMGVSTVLLVISVYAVFGPPAGGIQWFSIRNQWQNQDVVHYQNSIYGNAAVIQREGEYTFFSDGIPVITTPTPDVVFVEEFVHLPMLFHHNPREILVISGGAGGVINELLKYPLERIDYTELDPLILRLVERFSTPLTDAELKDPRVEVHYMDGRLFLKKSPHLYDAVLVGLSNPQDLQINRFFTRQFFSLVRNKLKAEGVLAFSLPGSTTYLGDELRDLNASIINTLREVYPYVRVIPGDGFNILMASPSSNISLCDSGCLTKRFEESGLATRFITPFHIGYKLDTRWSQWFSESMVGATKKKNEDFKPLGVYYSISHWNALFWPRLQKVFAFAGKLSFPLLASVLGFAGVMLIALMTRLKKPVKTIIPLAIATTGFAGMIFELALLFAFQALYGVVFYWVGLLVTAFMAGTAAGSFLLTHFMDRIKRDVVFFMKIEAAMVVFSLLLPLIFMGLGSHLQSPGLILSVKIVFLALSFLAGMLIGCQFPLAAKIYLKSSPSVGGTAGLLYGADLLGGWAGGIVGGVMLLPVLGLVGTCLILGLLKMISLLVFLGTGVTKSTLTY